MLNLCKRVNILLFYYRQIRDSINQISRYDFKLILNNILHYSVPCRQENVTKERSIRGKTCSPSLSREGVISKFRQRFECDWNCMSCFLLHAWCTTHELIHRSAGFFEYFHCQAPRRASHFHKEREGFFSASTIGQSEIARLVDCHQVKGRMV